MSKGPLSIDPSKPLDQFETVGWQLAWPRPVSHRLDQLVERAGAARTDRSELAAAIIAAAEVSPEELVKLVLAYRGAVARDVVLDVDPGAEVIQLPRYGPGRRKRSA